MEIIILDQGKQPDFLFCMLHGLGADNSDFVNLPEMLQLPSQHTIRFLLPNAPKRPITINMGMEMRGWYDITSINLDQSPDLTGATESQQIIDQILQEQYKQGFQPNKTILAGFSQGAAIALWYYLNQSSEFLSLVSLSGYLLQEKQEICNRKQKNTPIFFGHGLYDMVVPCGLATQSYQYLQKANFPVSMETYPIAHTICEEEIMKLKEFLLEKITTSS